MMLRYWKTYFLDWYVIKIHGKLKTWDRSFYWHSLLYSELYNWSINTSLIQWCSYIGTICACISKCWSLMSIWSWITFLVYKRNMHTSYHIHDVAQLFLKNRCMICLRKFGKHWEIVHWNLITKSINMFYIVAKHHAVYIKHRRL
jgi:hypothetical protein